MDFPQRILAMPMRSARLVFTGNVESQYLVGSSSPGGHSMSNHSRGRGLESVWSRWAGRTRTAAKRPLSGALVLSRQVMVFQACGFKLFAKSLAETGWCASSRRKRVPGRPRPPLDFGASGSWPGAQICDPQFLQGPISQKEAC